MHDLAGVHRAEPLRQPRAERGHLGQRERAVVAYRVVQGRAAHVGGGQPGRVAVGVGGHDLGGVEAADAARRGDLGGEAAPEVGIVGQLGAYDLDRDLPPARRPPEEHLSHAAAAQPGHHPVRTDPARLPRVRCAHDPPATARDPRLTKQ
ncbi:hypothetical protein GCM10020001_049340 [Nonomuraea salmonea]